MYFNLIVASTILSNYLIFCDSLATVINFEVTIENNTYKCIPERSKYILLENSPFIISVLHPSIINNITCDSPFEAFQQRPKDGERHIFQFTNWTPSVSLQCTLQSDLSATSHLTSAVATCKVAIHVRFRSPPQEIFINSIPHAPTVLPVSESNYDAEITHYYEDGDTVKVECANPQSETNSLRLDYSYFNTLNITDLIFPTKFLQAGPTSLRLGLTEDLNNTYAVCHSYPNEETYLVKINFIMRMTTNIIDLEVNGLTMRTTNDTRSVSIFGYLCKMGENVEIRCIDRNTRQYLPITNKRTNYGGKISDKRYIIKLRYLEEMNNNLYECQKDGVSKQVTIKAGPASNSLCAAYMDIKSLRHGAPVIIHEDVNDIKLFSLNGDAYNITCSGYCKKPGPLYLVQFDHGTGTGEYAEKAPVHNIVVNKKEQFNCMVKEKSSHKSIKVSVNLETNLMEIPKTPEISTTAVIATTEGRTSVTEAFDNLHDLPDPYFPPWLMAVVAGIAVLFLCCVSVVIYKRRKRRKDLEVQTTVNYVPQVDGSPKSKPEPYPELTYAQPLDQKEEPGYAEPFRQAVYATPLPKSERPGHNAAVGDCASVQKDVYSELKSLYAKVLPKEQRAVNKEGYGYEEIEPNLNQNDPDSYGYAEIQPKVEFGKGSKYANVFKGAYVNSDGGSNYAEPKPN